MITKKIIPSNVPSTINVPAHVVTPKPNVNRKSSRHLKSAQIIDVQIHKVMVTKKN